MITLIRGIKDTHELTDKSDTNTGSTKKNGYQRENHAEVGRGINQGLGISITLPRTRQRTRPTVWYRGRYSVLCNTLYGQRI